MCRNSVNVQRNHVQYSFIIFSCYLLLTIEAISIDGLTTGSSLSNLLKTVVENTAEEPSSDLGSLKFTPLEQNSAQSDETGLSADDNEIEKETGVIDYDSYPSPVPIRLVEGEEEKRELSEEELHERHEAARLNFILTFKEKMLDKLRMLSPPNVTDIHRYPQHVIEAFENGGKQNSDIQSDDPHLSEPDHYHAKITTSLRFAEKLPASKIQLKNNEGQLSINSLYFPVSENIDDNNVEKATLFIFPDYRRFKNSTVSHLFVRSNGDAKSSRLEKKLFESSNQHWEHVDITREVKSWARSQNRNNYGLTAEVQMSDGTTTPINAPESLDTKERIPFIKLELNDKEPRRRRIRSVILPRDCTINSQNSRCCRYKFVLDFDELGSDFNFVITPRRFTANYCMGECPSYFLPASANGHLTAGLTRGKTTRCCTATELRPLSMVFVGPEGTINSGEFPGMAVARCGCE